MSGSESPAAAVSTSISQPPTASPITDKPRLRPEFLNWTTVRANELYGRSGPATVQNFIGLNYRINADSGISAGVPFVYNYEYPKTNGTSTDFHTRDAYAEYTHGRLLEFWKNARLRLITARVGIPTGEDSRFITKTHGYFFGWLAVTKPLGRGFSLNWHLRARWHNQSQNTYIEADGSRVGTRDYGFEEWPQIEWQINPKLIVSHATGTSHLWYRSGNGVAPKRDFQLSSWSALTYLVTPSIEVTAAVSNDGELAPAGRTPGIYRNEETGYHLILFARI